MCFLGMLTCAHMFNNLPSLSPQTCQRDIKRLRERELSLQGDLTAASMEIMRLRELLQEFTASAASTNNGTIITNTTTML